MEKDAIKSLSNPVICRLLLGVQAKGRATAKELAQVCGEIPQTSLYRYLNKMTESGLLEVVETHPVRGTVEKVYGVADAFALDIGQIVRRNDAQGYLALFTQYMMGLLGEFQEYAARGDVDLLADGSGFTLAPAYLTKEEWEQALGEIGAVLARLTRQERTPERRLHTIGLILTPPKGRSEDHDEKGDSHENTDASARRG